METKIIQFGEGNFLRGFFDWMVQRLNERTPFGGMVEVVQPRAETLNAVSLAVNANRGRYRVCIRGVEGGKTVERFDEVECVKGVWAPSEIERIAGDRALRFVVSNTTEAGIEYREGVDTFPAKATRLAKARCEAGLPGLVFLPCELVEDNGGKLKACMLRYAGNDSRLVKWIERECVFCSTLVDRIVSGRSEDSLTVYAEPFHFWAIETPPGFDLEAELPLRAAGLNVVYADDITPYRVRKVRFLNGAHTSLVPAGRLAGFEFVDQLIADPKFNSLFRKVLFEEVFPTVELPDAEKRSFAESVLERFANPFAHHRLLSICLNSVAKWKVRVLPTILDYRKMNGALPPVLADSFYKLVEFCRTPELNDVQEVMDFFAGNPSIEDIKRNVSFWGMDITDVL